jgi:PAS domain S-box-containing protein
MRTGDTPIRRKLVAMILVTSGLVLLLTSAAFLAYEVLTFRRTALQQLSTLGQVLAANSTAALAFANPDDAREILAALKAERHIVAATLFDGSGRPFARYPETSAANATPAAPAADGYRFEHARLLGYQPVIQGDNRRLGTLYLEADLGAMTERLRLYGGIALLVMAGSFLVAYILSLRLQRQVSAPILALAGTAKAVSDRQDYSVRATKLGEDELGLLTDAFNQMLERIQRQNRDLTDSEARVRAVLNSSLSAVVVTDDRGAITEWNTRAETMFGARASEVLGHHLDETVFPLPERPAYRRAVERSLEASKVGTPLPTIEMTAWRRERQEFPVELSVSPLSSSEAVTYCSFITDITERKQAERKLHAQLARHDLLNRITRGIGERLDLPSIFQVVIRNLEDNLPIEFGCICLHDPERARLTVAGVGNASRKLARVMKLEEQVEIPVDRNGLARAVQGHLVYEADTKAAGSAFAQRFAGQGLRAMVVAPLLLESQVFGVLVAARHQPDSFTSPDCEFLRQLSEHVALAAHQAQVYTALQKAYDDLRQSQQTVLQQERLRALGQMASGIAHDINNAISPVTLYTQSLLEHEANLSPRAREYLETIDRAIDDVAATVARMREFYRPRGPQLMLAPTNLNMLVQQVLELTRAWWTDMPQQRGVVIEAVTALAPDLPPIMGAEGEIREALTNLVFNAVDAMTEGGTLTLRTGVEEPEADPGGGIAERSVYVEVMDTGQGMDEETLRRCLEPFYTTKGERGTGLGLAMVYGMVQRHSAEIEIDSALGRGTTIRLTFSAPSVAPSDGRSATPYRIPARMRILVVDDDPLVLKSLRDTLESDGHVIVTASGGQEGIDSFRAACDGPTPFALVITDLGMPHVDGRQVSSAIKQASPSTPVILLTGWGQRLTAEGDIPPHVDHLLSKPPKVRELRETLALCAEARS